MNNNADNKPGVMIYFDIIPLIEGMSPDDAGQLFLAILKYAQYGEIPSLSGFALAVWPFVKSLVDRDSQRYDLVRKKKQWAVYCREAKRRGETPLELEAWIIESERSPAINTDNHSSSPIIDDDVCYPTTTPAPAPTTATTPTTTTSPISSTADRGLGGTEHVAHGRLSRSCAQSSAVCSWRRLCCAARRSMGTYASECIGHAGRLSEIGGERETAKQHTTTNHDK